MRLAVELSGEHEALAPAEAKAVIRALDGRIIDELDRVVLAEDVDAQALADRVALAWRVIDVQVRCPVDVDEIVARAGEVELDAETFAVRCSRLDASIPAGIGPEIARRLGAKLEAKARVDLDEPDATVRVLLGEEAVIGVEQAVVDRSAYNDRHVEVRPHHSPITLHPRLARALVNLAQPRAGDRVWDPFAGTGGLALEASLVGAQAIASDLDPDMLVRARDTLAHYDAEATFHAGDVADVAASLGRVDAIVTDPPYGRASKTSDEGLADLYARFFTAAVDVLDAGSRLVCVFPDRTVGEKAPEALELVDVFEWYVHATLTRYIFVYERR